MHTSASDNKICALVAAAQFNSNHFLQQNFDLVIAVDGGYSHLSKMGITPNLAIGDFDSLGFVPDSVEAKVYPPEKDFSDLELALNWSHKEGYENIYVYGALGGRLDHNMCVLQQIVKYTNKGVRVMAIGEDQAVCAVASGGLIEFSADSSGVISVFSATNQSANVSIRGLKYEIQDYTLLNTEPLGLSNEFLGTKSQISVENGDLLIFFPVYCAPTQL